MSWPAGAWTASVEACGTSWRCSMSSTRWGVAFVSLNEGIDCTTPAGRLQLHILAALAEFERARIAERVRAGLAGPKRMAHVWAGRSQLSRPRSLLRWPTCLRGKLQCSCECRSRRSSDGGGRYDAGRCRVPAVVRGHRPLLLGTRPGVGPENLRESVALSPPVSGSSFLARTRVINQVFPERPRIGQTPLKLSTVIGETSGQV